MNNLIDSSDLLEAITNINEGTAPSFVKRKVVFVICPDPFENPSKSNDYIRYGFKCANDVGRRNETPILSYSFKLGLFGFNQWTMRMGSFSDQQLFDMQVSQMLRSNYIAVYGNDYTASMDKLLSVAKLHMGRIDFRTI